MVGWRHEAPAGDEVAHSRVPVVHICSNQRLFCSSGCVDAWLERTGNKRGYEINLATLWRLARG